MDDFLIEIKKWQGYLPIRKIFVNGHSARLKNGRKKIPRFPFHHILRI